MLSNVQIWKRPGGTLTIMCRPCAVTAGLSRPRETTRLHEDFVPTPWEPVRRPIQRDCTELPSTNPCRVRIPAGSSALFRGKNGL